MATTLYTNYIVGSQGYASRSWSSGTSHTNQAGVTDHYYTWALSATRTPGTWNLSVRTDPSHGDGLEVKYSTYAGGDWISSPLAEDVTISGTINVRLWGYESSMQANSTGGVVIERVSNTGEIVSEIANILHGTEWGTSASAHDFSGTPTSTDMKAGDRIRLRLYADDATGTTMGTDYIFGITVGAPTADASGDTWIQFTETFGLLEEDPTTQTLYLTDTASDVSTASVDREVWTSRGSGVTTDVTQAVTGFTDPIQMTDTQGGTVVDWFTPPLGATTLSGLVGVFVRCKADPSTSNLYAALRAEIAVVDGDGTNPVIYGATTARSQIPSTEYPSKLAVAGPDTAISEGQRIRVRLFIDDAASDSSSGGPMYVGTPSSNYFITSYYAGTSSGASGDSYLVFSQTLVAGETGPITRYGDFDLDAEIAGLVGYGDFDLDAWIIPNTGTGFFTLDAVILKNWVPGSDVTTFVEDSFTRTHGSSWESADVGGTYDNQTVSGISYATDGSAGLQTNSLTDTGASSWTRVGQTGAGDREILFRFKSEKLGTNGNGQVASIWLRWASGSESLPSGYYVEFKIAKPDSEGNSVTIWVMGGAGGSGYQTWSDVAGAADTWVWIKTQIQHYQPTTIRVKLWNDGDPEPNTWLVTRNDSTTAPNTVQEGLETAWRVRLINVNSGSGSNTLYVDSISVSSITRFLFSLDANIAGGRQDDFSLDAVILAFTLDDFTLDAWLQYPNRQDDFTLDAAILKTFSPTFSLDAWIVSPSIGVFYLDAVIDRVFSQTLTLDAVIDRVFSQTLTLDAILLKSVTDDFTLDALLVGSKADDFTLDAWIGSLEFSLDALIPEPIAPSIAAVGSSLSGIGSSIHGTGDWIKRRSTTSGFLSTTEQIAYGNGVWVATDISGRTYRSTDGISWGQVTTGYTSRYNELKFLNGYFVGTLARSPATLIYSDDGLSWTINNTIPWSSTFLAYGNGYWWGSGYSGHYLTATSLSGTWTDRSAISDDWPSSVHCSAAHYEADDDIWVMAGTGGHVATLTSTPIGTWSAATTPSSWVSTEDNVWARGIAYGDGYWVVVGSASPTGARIATATDPTGTWTERSGPIDPDTGSLQSIIYHPSLQLWVAVGTGTVDAPGSPLITATNPTGTWTAEPVYGGFGGGWYRLAWALPALVGNFSLDAILLGTIAPAGFTIDAEIGEPTPSFALDAQVVEEIFSDDFDRTVASGLGTSTGIRPIAYQPYPGEWSDPTASSVDGNSWLTDSGYIFSYFTGPPGALETLIVFDFWVPADLTDGTGDNWPAYIVGPGLFPGDYREYALIGSNGDGTWWAGTPWGGDNFTPTPSTMYRAKLYLKNAPGGYGRSKAWKVSDPEPEAWLSSWEITSHSFTGAILTDVGIESPEAEDGRLDNLHIYTFGGQIHWFGSLTVDAEIGSSSTTRYGDFILYARIGRWFTLDATIVSRVGERFVVSAFIARNAITLDAIIAPGGTLTIDALIVGPETDAFTVDAFIFDGTTRVKGFTLDALLKGQASSSFILYAELSRLVTVGTGSAPVDAICLETFALTFILSAEIDSGYRSSSFTVDADILGASEQRGAITLDAWLLGTYGERFLIEAFLELPEVFRLNAWLAGAILLDAIIVAPSPTGGATLDAWIAGAVTLDAVIIGSSSHGVTLDADILGADEARDSFTLDALVVTSRTGAPPIWLNAIIIGLAQNNSFTLDAYVQPYFTLDAWIAWTDGGLYGGLFSIDAYIRGNDTIIWPEDGGPATDSDGEPIPDWFKASRKYRLNITLDGTDVTGDVIWAQTKFTQNAKTNPGTFELTLRGVFGFDGGEEILVSLDDFRVFGGYVLTIERGYAFSADPGDPITTLRGADFNILFDKLIVYNKASADDPQGSYTIWKSFKKNTPDITIIHKVLSSYVDLPAGFDYTTFVDEVGNAAPEKPWTMPTAGSPLRQVMQSISQVTSAVWWIDPYLYLHYGSRTTITAPHPITDGLGGISGQNISMSEDISKLVTQTILWGTLAYTDSSDGWFAGEIMAGVKTAESHSTFGPWQYGEFRTDLHHQAYIDRRTDSIIERYGQPIRRAKVTIFEPGYQAGQVADVRLTEHGLSDILVIRQMDLSFAVAKEPGGGFFYCVPRYELTIGLDPEEPWDIYDYLPWPPGDGVDRPRDNGREEEDCTEHQNCSDEMFDDFTREVGNPDHSSAYWETYGSDWGASTPLGASWNILGPGGSNAWVENGVGKWMHTGDDSSSGQSYIRTYDFPSLWATNFTLTGKFHLEYIPVGSQQDPWPVYNWDPWFRVSFAGLYLPNGYYQQILAVMDEDGYMHLAFVGENGVLDDIPFSWSHGSSGSWYRFKWERSQDGVHHRVRVWVDGATEPSSWQIDVVDSPSTIPTSFGLFLYSPLSHRIYDPEDAGLFWVWFDDYQFCPDDPCEDLEGELFGFIGDGWNYETRLVENRRFETTARVARGTVSVYNTAGYYLHPEDDWDYDGSDGQHFILTTATDKVTVVYRAWVVNIGSEYSVPRLPDPSSLRHRPIPHPS